jgi:hypothetical protein
MHPETTYAEVLLSAARRVHHADTPRLRLCWAGACAGPEDGAAATISLREQYAIHARASKLLLQKHATAKGTPKYEFKMYNSNIIPDYCYILLYIYCYIMAVEIVTPCSIRLS